RPSHGCSECFCALTLGSLDEALKLAHAAELSEALFYQPPRVPPAQLHEGTHKLAPQKQCGVFRIDVCPVLRLRHDPVDHAKHMAVIGRHLECLRNSL